MVVSLAMTGSANSPGFMILSARSTGIGSPSQMFEYRPM